MMKRTQIGALCASGIVAMSGAPAMASELAYALTGYVELEHLDFSGGSETIATGDLGFSFGAPAFGSPGTLGFDAGLVFLEGDAISEAALYGALTYTMGPAKLSLGVPRSAYDSLNNMPPIGGIRLLDFELASISRGFTEFAYLFLDTDAPVGLRYDGDYNGLSVAASAHWIDDFDADSQALALRYQVTSNVALLADWERFEAMGAHLTTTRAGAELSHGPWYSGLSYFNRDPSFGPHTDGTETWITYMPTDQISISGTAFNSNVVDIYGMSMRYEWPVGAYGQIGIADGRSVDRILDLSVGFQF